MANSVIIPVQVNMKVNEKQLKGVSNQINGVVSSKGFKSKDFFAPITNSAKKLSSTLGGVGKSVNSLSSSFTSLKRIALSALSVTAIVKLGKSMVDLSSDLIEIQNVVDTTFGEMSDSINEFAQNALNSFGLTELQAKKYASTLGAIIKSQGITGDSLEEMSINLTKLTGDIASFYNMNHDEVYDKLRSGITGNVRAMQGLGVTMTVANLEAFALAQGIQKSWQEMSQAEKVALRYNYILAQTADSQGDFAKTSSTWANQVRILVSNFAQLGSILGGFLQKILYPVIVALNQIVSLAIAGAQALARMFGFDIEGIQLQQGVGSGGVDLGDTGADEMEDLADATGDAAKEQDKLNKAQKKSLANFHELNVLKSTDTDTSSGSSSGSGAGGVGGLSFELGEYKEITPANNPVSKALEAIKEAIETGDWEGLGALLADKVNSIFGRINIEQYIPAIQSGVENITSLLNGFVMGLDATLIGSKFGELFNTVTAAINSFFAGINWSGYGQQLADGVDGFVAQVSWTEAGKLLTNKFNAVFSFLKGFSVNFDWAGLGLSISEGLNSAVSNLDLKTAAEALFTTLNGIFETIGTFIINFDWSKLATDLSTGFNTLFTGIDYGLILATIILGIANIFEGIAEFLATINWDGIFSSVRDGINLAINVLLAIDWGSILENLSTGVINMFSALGDLIKGIDWMAFGVSIYTFIKEAVLSIKWGELIKSVFTLIFNAIGALSTVLVTLVVGFIYDLLTSITTALTKVADTIRSWIDAAFERLGEAIGASLIVISTVVKGGIEVVGNVIKTLQEAFDKIITFITGTFTKAWTGAWEGVKSVFTGIFDSLGGIFKGVVNVIIDVINSMIRGINKLSWDVPDWVPAIGGSKFGFNVPEIPRLARGAVIPPNQEFLAVLGDQRRGVNIETPLQTMLDAFRATMSEFTSDDTGDIIIPIYVDGELSDTRLITKQEMISYRSNGKR